MNNQALDQLIESNYGLIFLSGKVNIGKSDIRGDYHIGLERIGLCGTSFDDQFYTDCGVLGEEEKQTCLVETFDVETVRYRRLQTDHPIGDYNFCLWCWVILLNVVYHDTPLCACPYDGNHLRYWTDKTHMLCTACGSVEPETYK